MKKQIYLTLFILSIVISHLSYGQMRNIYTDIDANNSVQNFSYYSPSSGYVAFDNWIGFTQDTGRSFVKKYITFNNVNYNNENVNLTFGFTIRGVHAFSQDTLVVYGHYGFRPSILYSVDGGNSFQLTYHQAYNQNYMYDGVLELSFPSHAIGFAVIEDRVLKTYNKGLSWTALFSTTVKDLFDVQFLDNNTGYLYGKSQLYISTNGGTSWQLLPKPAGNLSSGHFINSTTGWIDQYAIYQTTDGGQTWTQKSDPDYYTVLNPIHFVNDSIGYATRLYDIIKTSDSGKTWETVERDNNYSYLSYGHNKFYFWNNSTFTAGGGHGFVELTKNAGGTTIPKALYFVDLSQLNNNNKIILENKSKPGNSYKWFKNSVQFSSGYNAEYITNRQTIDTVMLVVQKGSYSDTAIKIIDTRPSPHQAYASFQVGVDTASARFTNTDTAYGVKHYWYFGDGNVDSINAKPLHLYQAVGNYTVSHVTRNTIDQSWDSVTQVVTIVRTRNCLVADFTYTPDSFYTNKLHFTFSFDQTAESGNNALLVQAVNWGDGTTNTSANPHTYDSAKFYNVCFSIKNYYTGCINTICKPVQVIIPTGCDADFQISTLSGPPTTSSFKGKPVAYKSGKRNTWIINNNNTTVTGNDFNFETTFYTPTSGQYFNMSNNSCDIYAYEICIDSLNKTLKHIVYDSLSACADTVVRNFNVIRQKNIFIKAVPDPAFPQYVSFYAYQLSPVGDTMWYNTIWHIEGMGVNLTQGSYYPVASKLTYTFPYAGNYKVYVAANSCSNNKREVYYINYQVSSNGCGVYPPNFTYSQGNNNRVSFYPANGNPASNVGVWYWGDSTSSSASTSFAHTYRVGGMYDVTLRYTSPTNCVREITKPVFVSIPCNGNRIWLESVLAEPPGGFTAYQWQMNTGAGWTNVPNTGVYYYPDNQYTAGPTMKRLTITGAGASFNGYQYRCYNGTQYEYFTIRYTNFWTGTVSSAWENPANWSCGFVPDLNTTVVVAAGTPNSPVISSNATIYNLVVNNSSSLTVNTGFNLTVLH